MPIASLTSLPISLPAPAREGRAREALAHDDQGEQGKNRAGSPKPGIEQRGDAGFAPSTDTRGAEQSADFAQADASLAAAAREQQFIAAYESQRAQLAGVSASFENLSTMQSYALRSYQQTQNIDIGRAPAGSELIVGIDTFV